MWKTTVEARMRCCKKKKRKEEKINIIQDLMASTIICNNQLQQIAAIISCNHKLQP
jgi:hypothetical protein